MMDEIYRQKFSGLERIYGDHTLEALNRARVCVVGLGGVGSWTVEALARSGVGSLVLVDLDDICLTNVNRQLHALESQVGQLKTEAMAQRVLSINPRCEVKPITSFLTSKTLEKILTPDLDFVVDATDSVPDKAACAQYCLEHRIPLVISGGSGGKTDPTQVRLGDLQDQQGDALLKALKRSLKDHYGILPGPQGYGLPAVFSLEKSVLPWEVCSTSQAPEKGQRLGCASGFGSVSFLTGTFGFALASHVVNTLVRKSQA